MLSEEELDVIEHTYFWHWGKHLKYDDFKGETDEESDANFIEAYKNWIEESKHVKLKGKPYQYDAK